MYRSLALILLFFIVQLRGQLLQAQTTWNGSVSTDWANTANWSAGVPDAADEVDIPNVTLPNVAPVIMGGTVALAKAVRVRPSAALTINATGSLTIYDFGVFDALTSGFYNDGTVSNNGNLIFGSTTSTRTFCLFNRATFNNNSGGQISIDQSKIGLLNTGTFTNAGKITMGAVAGLSESGLSNFDTFNNSIGGEISIDQSSNGLANNQGTFTNAGKITMGAVASVGGYNILNRATFNNNSGGEISMNRSTLRGLLNQSGTFTNAGKITIGAVASVGSLGIENGGTFNNSTCTALINIVSNAIISNTATFTNAGLIIENASDNSSITSNAGIIQNLNGGTFSISTNTGLLTTSTAQTNACCFITGPTTVCSGAQITLNLACTAGGTWSSSNQAVATVNTSTGVVTGVSGGMASISYTAGSSTSNTIVTVNAPPNAAIAITENNVHFNQFTNKAYYNASYTDGILCTGPGFSGPTTSATLTASGGGSYLWNNNTTTQAITVGTAGTYTVVVTNAAACQSTTTKTISVNSAPDPGTITATPNIISSSWLGVCLGSTITLNSSVPGGVWTALIKNPQVASVNSAGVVTGLYNTPLYSNVDTNGVFYTVTVNGCADYAFKWVEVLDVPNAGTISGNTSICSSPFSGNNTTQLSIIGGLSGGTWMSSNTSVATVNATGLVSAAPTTTNLGTSIISYTVTSGSCSSSSTALITVNANPSALITSTPINTCVNQVVNISVPDAGTGATYNWSGDIVNINNNATTSVSSTPGTKSYVVTVTAGNGCVNSGSGFHLLNALPVVNITANPNPVCIGLTLDLSVPMAASTTYAWSGLGLNSTTGSNVTATIPTAGMQTYSVTAQTNAFLGSCSNTGTVNVMASSPLACPSVFSPSNGQNAVALNIGMLDWNDVPGATGYVVSFGTNAPDYNNILNGATTASSQITITALSPNLTYGYKVTPTGDCNASGCSTVIFSSCVPSFTCPANRDVALNSSCAMVIPDLVTGLAANPGCGSLTFMQNPTAGSIIASSHNGTVLVTITSNNTSVSSCAVTLTGKDLIAPTITCPPNIIRATDLNLCNASVAYPTPIAADNCAGAVASHFSGGVSGAVFQKGTTTVIWRATDGVGLTSSCSFSITVNDTQKPNITCPLNQTRSTDLNLCSAIVTYPVPTGADNCGLPNGQPVWISGGTNAAGSTATFQKGATTVIWQATDAVGNTQTCSFRVTVNDTQAPTLACPAALSINTTPNLCSAVATYTNPTFTDNCTPTTGTSTRISGLMSGSSFPAGNSNVVFQATDAAGNTRRCTMVVTVTDNQPPLITCPAPIVVNGSGTPCKATVFYSGVTASDNCAGTLTPFLVTGLASGSMFPAGVTTNTFRAIAPNGQSAECSLTITVNCGSGMSNSGLEDRDKQLEALQTMPHKTSLGLTIAPNPAMSFVTMGIEGVNANGGTLLVFDQIGRLVQQQVIAHEQRTSTLNVAEFAPGLYRISLRTDDGMVTKTLVVVKE